MKTFIEIPVEMEEGNGKVSLFNTEETDERIGKINILISSMDSLEEAKNAYTDILKHYIEYTWKRSEELNKWKPFQRGDWKWLGGRWITIFGIHMHFRNIKGMKGGWYIPFTKLNISIHNYWK